MAKFCPNGHEVNDNVRFCPICGAEVSSEVRRFCNKCGNERRGTEIFCSKCGTPYEGVPTPIVQETNHIVQSANSSPNNRIILPIIIGIIVLVLIGGGWWYFNTSKNKATDIIESVETAKYTKLNSTPTLKNGFFHDFGNGQETYHHLVGTFTDTSGVYPIEISFSNSGVKISNVIYRNIKVGSKISMTCTEFTNKRINFEGKDGKNRFEISLKNSDDNTFEGSAVVGYKEFVVNMKAKCSHNNQ